MCVQSMIMQDRYDEWQRRYYLPPLIIPAPPVYPFIQPPPLPTPEEIAEFRRLLEKARTYDKEHNEPNCELGEKRQKLKDMAKDLGVEIEFV